jgi:hypothetical protein
VAGDGVVDTFDLDEVNAGVEHTCSACGSVCGSVYGSVCGSVYGSVCGPAITRA